MRLSMTRGRRRVMATDVKLMYQRDGDVTLYVRYVQLAAVPRVGDDVTWESDGDDLTGTVESVSWYDLDSLRDVHDDEEPDVSLSLINVR